MTKRIILLTIVTSLWLLISWWIRLPNVDFSLKKLWSDEKNKPGVCTKSSCDCFELISPLLTADDGRLSIPETNKAIIQTVTDLWKEGVICDDCFLKLPLFLITDDDRLSGSEITNALALMTTLIDLRTEAVICLSRFGSHREDFFPETFESFGLSRSKIKRDIGRLLHENKKQREQRIKYINLDLKKARSDIEAFSAKPLADPPPPDQYDGNLIPLNTGEQMLHAIFSSHFKAILHEEVKLLLLERAESSNKPFRFLGKGTREKVERYLEVIENEN